MSRKIVEEVLGIRDVKEIWGTGYSPALPVTPQDYTMGGILPAVLYMMRWGHRRGKGKFFDVFGKEAAVRDVSAKLVNHSENFIGFDELTEQSILADLLLSYSFENKNRRMGREEQIQRVFPAHYFSSWIDLPDKVAHLRGVPEMFTAIVANQKEGNILSNQGKSHYSIGRGIKENRLLSLFGNGANIEDQSDNLRSDKFDESTEIGIDQLLAVRVAQMLGEAPLKSSSGTHNIPNQLPVATKATKTFFDDFNIFIRSYGENIPRQSLLSMIESCIAIGTTNIFLSTLKILLEWSNAGFVPNPDNQKPWELFVDCSASTDDKLRRFSEESVDDLLQRLSSLPICMMCLKILEQRAKQENPRALPVSTPDPTVRINYLGDLLNERLDESRDIRRDLRKDCNKLADALEEVGENHAKDLLENEEVHPAWRMAETIVYLMGDKLQGTHFRKFLDSSLMVDQPNGLAKKRRTILKGKSTERRSIVLTNTVIDFLVHRHLRQSKGKSTNLSLNRFIKILRDRYGFFVDEAPAGMSIPDDQLRKNRNYLERRLRDLGLFVGVNDAEAMKRLKQRYEVEIDAD
ncbi:MAG TPA: hypothetical protein VF648_05945 [Pyrinomonadaceae bacterium]|jgi:hypothetical protein